VHLTEDDLLILPMHRTPGADPPLQGAADSATKVGVSPNHLLENGDRAQTRCGLQQRHDLRLKDIGQGIRPAPFPRRLFLGRQARIGLDPVGGGDADRRLGGRDGG